MFAEPKAVVHHSTDKILRRGAGLAVAERSHTTAVFKTKVACKAESCTGDTFSFRVIIIPQQKAIVAVPAYAVRQISRILSYISIGYIIDPLFRAVPYLEPNARHLIEFAIGLPAIDNPQFQFKFIGRKSLYA